MFGVVYDVCSRCKAQFHNLDKYGAIILLKYQKKIRIRTFYYTFRSTIPLNILFGATFENLSILMIFDAQSKSQTCTFW